MKFASNRILTFETSFLTFHNSFLSIAYESHKGNFGMSSNRRTFIFNPKKFFIVLTAIVSCKINCQCFQIGLMKNKHYFFLSSLSFYHPLPKTDGRSFEICQAKGLRKSQKSLGVDKPGVRILAWG